MEKIEQEFDDFNRSQQKPYPLSVSMGCAEYPTSQGCAIEQFIGKADEQLYQMKEKKKALRSQVSTDMLSETRRFSGRAGQRGR